MQTIVSVDKQDSGAMIQLAVGDELRVTVPEGEATASWKAEVEGLALVSAASSQEGQYWEIGGDTQTSVHAFRAAAEGRAVVTMAYQAMAPTGVQVLDTFSLSVIVGTPPKAKMTRQRMPLPEMVFVMIEFLLLGGAGVALCAVLGFGFSVTAKGSQQAQQAEEVRMLIGVLGCGLFGTVSIFVLLRLIKMMILRRFK
jgi:predicted secreted protein